MNKLFFIFVLLLFSGSIKAQDKNFTGGFQFKAMLGAGVFSNEPTTSEVDSVQIGIQQQFGYVFGMTIRKQFTKMLAVESGLRFVQRNYTTSIDSTFGSYTGEIDYRLISYEIPLKGMVRLRASDNSFFSVSLGIQMDLYPSDIYASDYEWQVQVTRKSWIQGSFLANLGWEVHPQNYGTFYAGLSFNQPFVDPYAANVGHYNANFAASNMRLNGTYFSLDLRYYFEVKKDKPSR
jgi:hypothetical protein